MERRGGGYCVIKLTLPPSNLAPQLYYFSIVLTIFKKYLKKIDSFAAHVKIHGVYAGQAPLPLQMFADLFLVRKFVLHSGDH